MKKTRTKEAYCPTNNWFCPYYRNKGKCAIDEPIEECDDYMWFYYDEYRETGLNPYTDEERTVFENDK